MSCDGTELVNRNELSRNLRLATDVCHLAQDRDAWRSDPGGGLPTSHLDVDVLYLKSLVYGRSLGDHFQLEYV